MFLILFASLPGLHAQAPKQTDNETAKPTLSKEDLDKQTNDIKRLLRDANTKASERIEEIKREQSEETARQLTPVKEVQNELLTGQKTAQITLEERRKADLRQTYVAVGLLALFLVVLAVLAVRSYKNRSVPAVTRPRDIRVVEVPAPLYTVDSEGILDNPTIEHLRQYVKDRNFYHHEFLVRRYLQDDTGYLCWIKIEAEGEPVQGKVKDDPSGEWIGWKNLPKRAATIMSLKKVS